MTVHQLGAVLVSAIALLAMVLALRYRGMPGRGVSWVSRDEDPLIYWTIVGLLGCGVAAGIATLLWPWVTGLQST